MDLHNPIFLSHEVGIHLAIPQRTIQGWTEKGLISASKGTKGTGDRRLYSIFNLIEIGTIKNLRNLGLSIRLIEKMLSQ